MVFVFVRSRAGSNIWAARTAARNCPCIAGSASSASAMAAAVASRTSARAAFWRAGAAPSGESRMRSTAARASVGTGLPASASASPTRSGRATRTRSMNSSRIALELRRALVRRARARRSARPSAPPSNSAVSAGVAGHDAAQVPHRERRRGRVDVAQPAEQIEGRRRLAHRGADRRQDADRQRRDVRDVDVLREQHRGSARPRVPTWRSTSASVGQRAEVGAVGAEGLRRGLVVEQLGQSRCGERPPEGLRRSSRSGRGRRRRAAPRTAGCPAGRRRTARPSICHDRPGARSPNSRIMRGVQVAVAAGDAELLDLVGVELVVVEGAHAHPRVAPAPARRAGCRRRRVSGVTGSGKTSPTLARV